MYRYIPANINLLTDCGSFAGPAPKLIIVFCSIVGICLSDVDFVRFDEVFRLFLGFPGVFVMAIQFHLRNG